MNAHWCSISDGFLTIFTFWVCCNFPTLRYILNEIRNLFESAMFHFPKCSIVSGWNAFQRSIVWCTVRFSLLTVATHEQTQLMLQKNKCHTTVAPTTVYTQLSLLYSQCWQPGIVSQIVHKAITSNDRSFDSKIIYTDTIHNTILCINTSTILAIS